MRPTRTIIAALLVALALGLVACGGGSDDDEASEAAEAANVTPAQAVTEIAAVRKALDDGVAALQAGDRDKADDLVSDGYLEHFEKVEGPLEQVDGELKEELEEKINGDIRDKIKDGASAADVEKLVDEAKQDLAEAETKLKS
jgi:hypothetical protein